MNTDVILDYLMELERNNNREFYHAHKTVSYTHLKKGETEELR